MLIGGLYPLEPRTHLQKGATTTYVQAYALDKNMGRMQIEE